MWRIIVLVVAIFAHGSHALTDAEIAIFKARNTGACNNEMTITETDDEITFETNSLPDHMWGCENKNPVGPQTDHKWTVPKNPTNDYSSTGKVYCLSMGAIGISLNGVPFYHPLNAFDTNAVEGDAQEIFDCCGGHPDAKQAYHYHKLPQHDINADSSCDNPIYDKDTSEPKLVGVALDGFPIYTGWDDLDEADLDLCHGTTLPDGTYAYIASIGAQQSDTFNFPYILGCYVGSGAGNKPCSRVCTGENPVAGENQLCSCSVGIVEYDRTADTTTASCPRSKRSLLDVHMEETLARREVARLGRTADSTCFSTTCNVNSNLDYCTSSDSCENPRRCG